MLGVVPNPPGPSWQQSLRSDAGAQAYEGDCSGKSAVQQHSGQPGGKSGRLAAYRPDVRWADRSGRSYNRANEPHSAIVANSSCSNCSVRFIRSVMKRPHTALMLKVQVELQLMDGMQMTGESVSGVYMLDASHGA